MIFQKKMDIFTSQKNCSHMYSKTLLIRFIRLDLLEQGGQENHRASCMVTVTNNQRQNLYKFSILFPSMKVFFYFRIINE